MLNFDKVLLIIMLKPSCDGFFYFYLQFYFISVNHFVLKSKKIRFVNSIKNYYKLSVYLKYILDFIFLLPNGYCYSVQVNSKIKNLFVKIGIEEGLSSPVVNVLFQDSIGYMWIGTENGLCRYDGYNFVVFTNIIGDSCSISSNKIGRASCRERV